jgi:hypothetical protein
MKKLLLFTGILFACVAMQAQNIIFQDNFDSYAVGGKLAALNTNFTTWSAAPGGAEDGTISIEQASSPSNSVKIITGNDLVFPIANYTTGEYVLEFDYYVPSTGTGAYFNVLHSFDGSTSEWALECYFYNTGTGYLMVGGSAALDISFNYPVDQWFHVYIQIDLTNDETIMKVNGTDVHTWPFHYTPTETTGLTQLGGMDFFSAAPPSGTDGTYFIDNFVLREFSDVNVNEVVKIFEIYPNPATTVLNIKGSNIQSVEIFNIVGQKIYTGSETSIDVANYLPGTYFVKVTTSEDIFTKKAIIR